MSDNQQKAIEQAFEKHSELSAILYHAAHKWRTDMQWTNLLSEINELCLENEKLVKENQELTKSNERFNNCLLP